ncbi:hypothetical protein AVEN_119522-1 [Araneus ventricosus]|uniref:Uncharacterized protein n=1 Tax=Araneus ventricosus TaxID=182803 RepID=A0A4Y2SB43_ARAVE|nr:hypothetical protein AVEN_119522-1 [Araneus ventricosus]
MTYPVDESCPCVSLRHRPELPIKVSEPEVSAQTRNVIQQRWVCCAGLQQQHTHARFFRQTVGQSRAGGAATNRERKRNVFVRFSLVTLTARFEATRGGFWVRPLNFEPLPDLAPPLQTSAKHQREDV